SHGSPLGKEEIALVKKAMGWDPDQHFAVPEKVTALFRAREADLQADKAGWSDRFASWKKQNPERAAELDAFEARHVPETLYEDLLAALPSKDDATRGLSNALQQVVAEKVPSLVGGSADLAPS